MTTFWKESKFFIGESISSNGVIRDLVVTENKGNGLKVSGNYTLSAGEKIKGIESGSEGTINTLKINEAVFDVKFSNLLGTISARAYIGKVNVKINIQTILAIIGLVTNILSGATFAINL